MIAATLLALAGLTTTAPAALPTTGYTQDTMRHLKGHGGLPVRADAKAGSSANKVCHPDPNKGRACRHHLSKKEEARREAVARNEVAGEAVAR